MPKKYIIEARKADGTLDTNNQTPFLIANEIEICNYYFQHNTNKESATWEEIHKYFNGKGWYIREKTW